MPSISNVSSKLNQFSDEKLGKYSLNAGHFSRKTKQHRDQNVFISSNHDEPPYPTKLVKTFCIMEMTFYDDTMFRPNKSEEKSLKRPATLNLESPDSAAKRQRFASILTSPDLQMLKLASPELERFIISNGNITTTPTPTQYLFPKTVTEEQEQYARGFIDALNHLHQQTTQFEMNTGGLITRISSGTTPVTSNPPEVSIDKLTNSLRMYPGLSPLYFQSSPTSVIKSSGNAKNPSPVKPVLVVRPPSVDNNSSNSCNSMSSNSTTMPLEIAIKEELQTVPNELATPPLSPLCKGPIDMADQERIKLERKRYRNRLAASKCRKRKLEKISQLEDKVKELKGENSKLELIVERLRDQVCSLKQEVLDHAKKGCQIMVSKLC
ncbi:transcription factor AP-1 [Caerostris darwini]|uniref:Transcription factor AP-1 n=1 Tax=Caerostris darwini TaxID=1538125 RepID=A0AAV4TZG1_9ARAC|nr:transcription factor AP-1 [Caerostris darwini]